MHTSSVSRWTTVATVCLLAAIAAVVSYAHMFELALRHGEPAWRAGLFPLSVDGMIVTASMALLSDARQGRRGGVLPWTLLIVGSAASLAANVAVADPTVWSRVIHAWPSFTLMGAYELLMRHFRVAARGERAAHADDEPLGMSDSSASDREGDTSAAGMQDCTGGVLHVVGEENGAAPRLGLVEPGGVSVPPVQVEAWNWVLDNRRDDGSLPTGGEIAAAFGRKQRWGRLVKQRGQQGAFRQRVA
ncbi:hypothetical protein F4561_001420 [Lipingzhangella halophila]|uniref:DUF2637 domain-containing protein n=1 Tax=Lipingzhangella halophila TaxID=1783352 RepID=A0A7W7W2F7_9ACTN|nr:DUF2637 domain-containing protein [Lipingzhangella halophila]MBB4930600.1 hypothetical protein [Lipingzhangella halophila]